MPNAQKVERVAELREQIEGSTALLLTEYRGLTVSEITELRRSLREGGASFAVIKNTLMRRALEGTDAADLESLFEGPSAVAFVHEDPVAAAKSVTAAARKFPTLILKGGYVEGRVLSADQAKALADLESREVMLSKLAGMMKAEMTRAAGMFQAAQSRFLSLLEAFKEKLPAEAEPAAETGTEAPAAEAAPSEPAADAGSATEPETTAQAEEPAPTSEAPEAPEQNDDVNDPEATASDGPEAEASEGEE